jgi:hypothetical protein
MMARQEAPGSAPTLAISARQPIRISNSAAVGAAYLSERVPSPDWTIRGQYRLVDKKYIDAR